MRAALQKRTLLSISKYSTKPFSHKKKIIENHTTLNFTFNKRVPSDNDQKRLKKKGTYRHINNLTFSKSNTNNFF